MISAGFFEHLESMQQTFQSYTTREARTTVAPEHVLDLLADMGVEFGPAGDSAGQEARDAAIEVLGGAGWAEIEASGWTVPNQDLIAVWGAAGGGIFAVGISLPSTLRGSSHQRQSPTLAGCTHLFHGRSCRSLHEIYCQGSSGLVRRSVSARPGAHAPLVKDRTAQARKMGVASP